MYNRLQQKLYFRQWSNNPKESINPTTKDYANRFTLANIVFIIKNYFYIFYFDVIFATFKFIVSKYQVSTDYLHSLFHVLLLGEYFPQLIYLFPAIYSSLLLVIVLFVWTKAINIAALSQWLIHLSSSKLTKSRSEISLWKENDLWMFKSFLGIEEYH
jgi:hypothetical protein